MNARKIGVLLALAAIAGATVSAVWAAKAGAGAAQEIDRYPARTYQTYQTLGGQIATTSFGAIYVLNNEYRQLAVLKYDAAKNELTPIAVRDLAKDFDSDVSNNCSMTTIQLGDQAGLIYITDPGYDKVMLYKVELANAHITPLQPLNLRKLFDH
jgi:hypothetical protein